MLSVAAASSSLIRASTCFITSGSAETITRLVGSSATIRAVGIWRVVFRPLLSVVEMALVPTAAVSVAASSEALALLTTKIRTAPGPVGCSTYKSSS